MNEFKYSNRSYCCLYKGCWLDSLLELRFILSIETTHYWFREDLKIYYKIDDVPEGIKGGLASYTPDFLIRDKLTGKATLVEIKPEGFNDKYELLRRRKIAEEFILRWGYDWEFQVIFSNQITLSKKAKTKFLRLRGKSLRVVSPVGT